jgi:Gpi18-like mannosyltransferase
MSRLRTPLHVVGMALTLWVMVSSMLMLRASAPAFGIGTYQFEGRDRHEFTMPLYLNSESGMIHIETPLTLPDVFPTLYSVTPDDCLEELTVNDQPVSLPRVCLDQRGVTLDLGEYLHPGANTLKWRVQDGGGYGGLSVTVSPRDPFVWFPALVFLAACGILLMLLLSLFKAPRAGYLLAAALLIGLVLRLVLAQAPGYGFDIGVNQGWSKSAVVLGLADSYEEQVDGTMLPNYPPFSMLIFGSVGHLYRFTVSPNMDRFAEAFHTVIKLPGITADLLTCVVLFFFIAGLRTRRQGLIAAWIYALHPAVFYDSAVWGQVDSVYTLLILASLLAASRKFWIFCGVFAALAVLTKLQSAILAPAMLAFLFTGWRQALRIVLGGLATALVVLLPFVIGGSFDAIWNVYTNSVGYYSSLSYGAYNLWQGLMGGSAGQPDTDALFGIMSYRHWGLLFFGGTAALFLALRWKQMTKLRAQYPLLPTLFTALMAYAFFVFNTQMHERYLFPLMALALPIIFVSRRTAVLYALSSLFFLLNLMGVLPAGSIDKALFSAFPNFPAFIGTVHTCLFFWMFATLLQISRLPSRAKPSLGNFWKRARSFFARKRRPTLKPSTA